VLVFEYGQKLTHRPGLTLGSNQHPGVKD
jgi:hypothetical protein